MSNFSGYKTKSFSRTQKFFVLDPQTGGPAFVPGSELIAFAKNFVYSEATRETAVSIDYPVGVFIQTAGATSARDNFGATYLVVASGEGNFPMDNGNELLVIQGDKFLREDLVKPVATYDNVASMKGGTSLDVGRITRTLGYYTPGDGGGNDYEIVASGTGTADGGSFIDLDNGVQAKGLFPVVPNIRQFGASPDLTDNSTTVQAAVNYALGGSLLAPLGEYLFLNTVEAASGLYFYGEGIDTVFKFGPTKTIYNVPIFQSANNSPARDVKNLWVEHITFDGGLLTPNRWLQDWNDLSPISDPENDYFANGGGIENTGANYISDDNYIALSQSGTSGVALTLANTTMPLTESTSTSSSFAASRRLRVRSAGDDTGVSFSVVGTDYEGEAFSEDIVGVNAGIAEGKSWFKTVTSVTPDSNTASTVEVGIEEYDIGSTASAGRRNPKYTEASYLVRLSVCESSHIRNCVFRNHYGPAVEEAGGLNVDISNNYFDTVGKNDGAFPAVWTQSLGTPGGGQSFFQDSENITIRNNVANNLERSFALFSPTKGGTAEGNKIDSFGEACFFISGALHANGGASRVANNKITNGIITDIVSVGVEANAVSSLTIEGNEISFIDGEALSLPGCTDTLVQGNRFLDVCNTHTIPYAPFSERFGFNVGLSAIAGDVRDIADEAVVVIGTLGGIGTDRMLIRANFFKETRASLPNIFQQTKTGGDNLSKSCIIEDNQLSVPPAMVFLDAGLGLVWDATMPLSIRRNVGHVSEAPVVISRTLSSGVTGFETFDVGFRPSAVHITAAHNNLAEGESWVGFLSWTSDGTRNDGGLRQALNISGTASDATANIVFPDFIRVADASGAESHSSEFLDWLEKGFRINIITSSAPIVVRLICYP